MTSVAYGALWLFVFALPWERILVLPGVSIASRVTGGLALVMAILAVVISGRFRRLHSVHLAALLFVVWAGVVLLLIDAPEIPAKFWTFVQLLAVLWMIWELARTRERQMGLLLAYVAGAYVAAVDTLVLYRQHGSELRRFAAGGGDANDSAMLLGFGLPMAWYLGMKLQRPLLRWGCRAYLPLGLVALGLTGSRGGMLASLIGLSIIPLTMTRLSPGRRAVGMILLSVSLVVAALNTPDTLIQRLASTSTEVEEANLGGRGKIWAAGVKAFSVRPIVGYGTAYFKQAVRPFGIGQVAHNSFLSVLVEQGLVGLVIFLTMFAAVALSLRKLTGLDRRFGLVLLTQLGVAMLPLTWEDQRAVWVILAVLAAFSEVTIALRHQVGGPLASGAVPPAAVRAQAVPRPGFVPAPGARRGRQLGR